MLTMILGFITGMAGPISAAVSKLTDLNIAKVQASTDAEKLHIDAQIAEAHDRVMVLQAEAGSRVNAIIRAMLALGPMIFLWKVFVWDKVVGSFAGYTKDIFTTDALDSNLWSVVIAVLSFYFIYDMSASWRRK